MTTRTMAAAALMLAATSSAIAETPAPYVVCAHVPITGAMALPHDEERFGQFYFDYVNAELGGVDGHPVEYPAYNDEFSPAGARRAVEKCIDRGAQIITGLYGPDQSVSVARWAEQNGIPYLRASGPASEPELQQWSAFIGPTDEEQMTAMASALLDGAEETPTIGMVRINSPYYDPGHDAFVDALAEHDITMAVDAQVQKDESNFGNVWRELSTENVRIVNLYATPHIFVKMMGQRPVNYNPAFVSISTLMGTNIVATAGGSSRVSTFHDPSPVYDPDDASLPWHDEILEFQRIFRTYSPEQNPPMNEIDWLAYLRAKQIHRFLDALDEDLSAEHVRGMFSTYAEDPDESFPTCALDFRPTPRLGSHAWHVFDLDDGAWRQAAYCADIATSDLTPPTLTCADASVAVGPVRCSFQDPGSGIRAYSIRDQGVPSSAAPIHGDGACATTVEESLTLPPGVHRLTVTATNCAGISHGVGLVYLSVPG